VRLQATVYIADAIVSRASSSAGGAAGLTAARLDYYLWRSAVVAEEAGQLADFPFHRTRTCSY
jgi:hypothetical protein